MSKGPVYDYDVNDIIAMYESGMTYRDIASKIGMTFQNVGHILRKHGVTRGRGGKVASTIPEQELQPTENEQYDEEIETLANKNAANACLVVSDHVINLAGAIGKYEVCANKKRVRVEINGETMNIDFDNLSALVEEFKALARNVGELGGGWEMW